jgi:hypothetical protein
MRPEGRFLRVCLCLGAWVCVWVGVAGRCWWGVGRGAARVGKQSRGRRGLICKGVVELFDSAVNTSRSGLVYTSAEQRSRAKGGGS